MTDLCFVMCSISSCKTIVQPSTCYVRSTTMSGTNGWRNFRRIDDPPRKRVEDDSQAGSVHCSLSEACSIAPRPWSELELKMELGLNSHGSASMA